MNVQVWLDVVCPWCYVGKRRFEEALERFEHRNEVDLLFRSFELDPRAPRVRPETQDDYLARKYRMSVDQARASHRRLADLASEHGIVMRFELAKGGNSFDAHRLLHLAADRKLQAQLAERLMAAYFAEGRAIGEPDVLAVLASEVGLPADDVTRVLTTEEYADAVRSDEALAREYDITGVPFFVIDEKFAVAGAQRSEILLDALEQAWSEVD